MPTQPCFRTRTRTRTLLPGGRAVGARCFAERASTPHGLRSVAAGAGVSGAGAAGEAAAAIQQHPATAAARWAGGRCQGAGCSAGALREARHVPPGRACWGLRRHRLLPCHTQAPPLPGKGLLQPGDGLQAMAADSVPSASLMVVWRDPDHTEVPQVVPNPPDEQARWDQLSTYNILDTVGAGWSSSGATAAAAVQAAGSRAGSWQQRDGSSSAAAASSRSSLLPVPAAAWCLVPVLLHRRCVCRMRRSLRRRTTASLSCARRCSRQGAWRAAAQAHSSGGRSSRGAQSWRTQQRAWTGDCGSGLSS